MTIKPHVIQKEALRALRKARAISKKKKALNVMPSGIGKTHLAAFDTKRAKAQRILYIAHRREILEQAESIFKEVYGYDPKDKTHTGFIMGYKKEFDKPIIFATIQTLSRTPTTLEKLAEIHFDYTIIDEYHHVAADSYLNALDALQTRFLLGLTATPYRLDGKDIFQHVGHNLTYSMELEEGIKRGELVPFYYHALNDNIDYSDIYWNGHQYRENDLNKKLIIDKRDAQIIEEYEKSIAPTKRRTMIFCVSVKHADRMSAKLCKRGIRVEALTHHTPIIERRRIVANFRAGLFDVLCVRDIFNEGVDFPEVSAIMFLRPTFSRTVFFQQLGRGLRKSPQTGKKDVTVFDFVSNYHNAYKITEWLSQAQQTDKPAREQKPEYHHSVPLVYFDKRVMDIFRLQKKERDYMIQLLIENYHKVKDALGRSPTHFDFQVNKGLSRFSYSTYIRYFGSMEAILKASGAYVPRPTREEVKADYMQVLNEILESSDPNARKEYAMFVKPTKKWILKIHKYHGNIGKLNRYWIDYYWRSYTEFLVELGLVPVGSTPPFFHTKETLIENYRNLYNKLGRVPYTKELNNAKLSDVSVSAYKRLFGGWTNFLNEMKADPPFRRTKAVSHAKYTRQDIIDVYHKAKEARGDGTTPTELDIKYIGGNIAKPISREFGGMHQLIDHCEHHTTAATKGTRTNKCMRCGILFSTRGTAMLAYCSQKCRQERQNEYHWTRYKERILPEANRIKQELAQKALQKFYALPLLSREAINILKHRSHRYTHYTIAERRRLGLDVDDSNLEKPKLPVLNHEMHCVTCDKHIWVDHRHRKYCSVECERETQLKRMRIPPSEGGTWQNRQTRRSAIKRILKTKGHIECSICHSTHSYGQVKGAPPKWYYVQEKGTFQCGRCYARERYRRSHNLA